jgi:hypothetical protein
LAPHHPLFVSALRALANARLAFLGPGRDPHLHCIYIYIYISTHLT